MKYAFLILNYNTENQTEECINEILHHTSNIEDKRIFVLDNGSSNSNLKEKIQVHFLENKNITFFYNEKNIGFANGNNFLYEKAKCEYDADFYIFLNNDVYIVSNDFCQQINDEYSNSGFCVLGPRIILGNNTIDSCTFDKPSISSVKKEYVYWKTINLLSKLHLAVPFAYFIMLNNILKKYLHKNKKIKLDKSRRRENVLLQGACLVFSKKFFDYYNEPFDKRTFLYKEEELLFLRCLKYDLSTVFLPSLIVFHEGAVSTVKNTKKNQLFAFRARYYLESLRILIKELEN